MYAWVLATDRDSVGDPNQSRVPHQKRSCLTLTQMPQEKTGLAAGSRVIRLCQLLPHQIPHDSLLLGQELLVLLFIFEVQGEHDEVGVVADHRLDALKSLASPIHKL